MKEATSSERIDAHVIVARRIDDIGYVRGDEGATEPVATWLMQTEERPNHPRAVRCRCCLIMSLSSLRVGSPRWERSLRRDRIVRAIESRAFLCLLGRHDETKKGCWRVCE